MTVQNAAWKGPAVDPGDVRRVAVFRALHLGDFLCAVPAMRALDARFPGAEITLIGLPWTRNIIDRFQYIDRFLEFPGFWGLEQVPWDETRSRRFFDEATQYGYDLAIQLHGDGRVSNSFVARLGARRSIGYRKPSREVRPILDLEIPFIEEEHEILRCLRLVEAIGGDADTSLEFPLTPPDRHEVDSLFRATGIGGSQRLVVIHPGASAPDKRWPAAMFARAADRIAFQTRSSVIITGTSAELGVAQEVASSMKTHSTVLAGKTTIGGLAEVINRASLLVSNDSGPSHLAVATGTPSIVLFGPSSPERWAPLNSRLHRPIRAKAGGDMSTIPIQRVVDESIDLVNI